MNEIIPNTKNTIKTTCSFCKKEFDYDVYPLIDLQTNKDLYEDLFSLNLFRPLCPHCKKNNIIQYNTLIVDKFKKYMVYLYQPEQLEIFRTNIDLYMKMLKENDNPEIMEVFKGLKHTRVVVSLNDMLQKLLIFDYDLNDKIIELLKRGLYENKLLNEDQFDCIEFNKIDRDKLLFTCFSTKDNSITAIKDISVEFSYYNALVDALGNATKETNETNFPLIDKHWAINIVNLSRNNK